MTSVIKYPIGRRYISNPFVFFTQEMLTMSLACMELQLEQWSHTKGKNSECPLTFPVFISYYASNHNVKAVY